MTLYRYAAGLFCVAALASSSLAVDWMPFQPGSGSVSLTRDGVLLQNRCLRLQWTVAGTPELVLMDLWNGQVLRSRSEPFTVVFRNGTVRSASEFEVKQPLHVTHGYAESVYKDPGTGLQVTWRMSLAGGSNYVHSQLSLLPTTRDVDVSTVTLVDLEDGKAKVVGQVAGSPLADGEIFASAEHPMAVVHAGNGVAASGIVRKLPLRQGQTTVYTAVFGVAPAGQLRRGFLRYVERERARPYKPFLHYNSWYDLGYFNRYTADQCVQRINAFATELGQKRGAKLSSFLFDDGWDDTHTVWHFNSGFPQEFTPLKAAAEKVGAGPGVWLSPWGGYGTPNRERLAAGKAAGMEIDSEGYALSGPKYYQVFRQITLDFVRKFGINQFKFDGTGSPDKQYPGSHFGSDFEAAIQLIEDLRHAKPGLFINLTTGTWPSPFWTRYADSIWRGGEDHSFAGVGTWREKCITYRDGDTYHGIVQQGPLYPLNSLMLHGLIYAQYANHLKDDPGNDFRNEVRDYFGTGTQLQEMYITPTSLSTQNWDDLAEAAKWSQANADVLVDTHWVGGDPTKLQVYGWASWSPRKGILVLRNPSDHEQTFDIDPSQAFELPPDAKGAFRMLSPYKSDIAVAGIELPVGQTTTVTLAPFQVMALEGSLGAASTQRPRTR